MRIENPFRVRSRLSLVGLSDCYSKGVFSFGDNMTKYSEQLKDPRWQRKRLEVFQKSDFMCEQCGSETKQLHAHHKYYDFDRDVWDYPNEDLMCLCESCHKDNHALDKLIKKTLKRMSYDNKARLVGYAEAVIGDVPERRTNNLYWVGVKDFSAGGGEK